MINVGIIGFGIMGKIRAKAINGNGYGKIIQVYDKDKNIDFQNYEVVDNYDQIIDNPKIDAVFLCTPNFLNAPLTIKAMKAGKHVFCEKPPALNSDELLEVKKVQEETGKMLMYGFNHRHHSSVKYMKSLIDSGEYGKILWMRGRYGKSVSPDFFKSWRADKRLSGGGILLDQGIHMLDLFMFMGGCFDKVHAFISNLYWKCEIEDNAFVLLKNNQNGVVAQLHSTMTQWRHLFSLEIFLEKGYLVLNGLKTSSGSYGEEVLTIAKNRTTAPAATWEDEEKITYNSDSFWRSEIDHFMDSLIHDKPPVFGCINDALNLMKIIDKIYEIGTDEG